MRVIIAILTAGLMLMAFAACDSKKEDTAKEDTVKEDTVMKAVYEDITSDESYISWKEMYPNATIEEKLDGDYIIYTTQDKEDYNGYTFFNYIKRAVADYYGMSSMLMRGYVAGLDAQNEYMTEDMENGVYKLYAKEWDMKGLDTMYVDEKAMDGQKELFDMSHNIFVDHGKVYVKAYGTADDFAMVVAEYGENTELTYKSIMAAGNIIL